MTATITIDTLDGSGQFSGYIAKPQAQAKAAIVVILRTDLAAASLRRTFV